VVSAPTVGNAAYPVNLPAAATRVCINHAYGEHNAIHVVLIWHQRRFGLILLLDRVVAIRKEVTW